MPRIRADSCTGDAVGAEGNPAFSGRPATRRAVVDFRVMTFGVGTAASFQLAEFYKPCGRLSMGGHGRWIGPAGCSFPDIIGIEAVGFPSPSVGGNVSLLPAPSESRRFPVARGLGGVLQIPMFCAPVALNSSVFLASDSIGP